MISYRLGRSAGLGGLVFLIVCLLASPDVARADSAIIRNDTTGSVLIQVASVQRGMLRRDQVLVRVGETTPKIALDTDKTILVTDTKTGRILYRNALRASKIPIIYSLFIDRVTGRLVLVQRRVMLDGKMGK